METYKPVEKELNKPFKRQEQKLILGLPDEEKVIILTNRIEDGGGEQAHIKTKRRYLKNQQNTPSKIKSLSSHSIETNLISNLKS